MDIRQTLSSIFESTSFFLVFLRMTILVCLYKSYSTQIVILLKFYKRFIPEREDPALKFLCLCPYLMGYYNGKTQEFKGLVFLKL